MIMPTNTFLCTLCNVYYFIIIILIVFLFFWEGGKQMDKHVMGCALSSARADILVYSCSSPTTNYCRHKQNIPQDDGVSKSIFRQRLIAIYENKSYFL